MLMYQSFNKELREKNNFKKCKNIFSPVHDNDTSNIRLCFDTCTQWSIKFTAFVIVRAWYYSTCMVLLYVTAL